MSYLSSVLALSGLLYADMPLRNYPLTPGCWWCSSS